MSHVLLLHEIYLPICQKFFPEQSYYLHLKKNLVKLESVAKNVQKEQGINKVKLEFVAKKSKR